ncbi:carotenoid biosynthesis protein [Flavobacteriales bacterium]|nr:carotenoid biosynthesis protein [Flavobacteriales bacterium]
MKLYKEFRFDIIFVAVIHIAGIIGIHLAPEIFLKTSFVSIIIPLTLYLYRIKPIKIEWIIIFLVYLITFFSEWIGVNYGWLFGSYEYGDSLGFKIDESSNVEQSKYLQAYELECSYNPNNIMDPFSNIYINIQQNHQDFDQQWISGPSFIKENKLVFLPSDSQIFNGGNEFRFFDMSSFRIGSQKIDKIYFNDTTFQILLKEDEKRSYKQYLQYKEMNGRFFIRTYDNDQEDFQSEYGWVQFRLPMRKLVNDSIYIYGQISNWAIDDRFLMKYDSLSKSYFNKSILKQGYYNYIYVVKNSQGISTRKIEGSHFETSNEYVVKIYYEDPLNLYDRILCYNLVKSN